MKKRVICILLILVLVMVLVPMTSFAEETHMWANVDGSFNIIIPATVQFGTIAEDPGGVSRPFNVEAQNVSITPGAAIHVVFDGANSWDSHSTLALVHGSTPEWYLPYTLNNASSAVGVGDEFQSFTEDGVEAGHVDVDTSSIPGPGDYSDVMYFSFDVY